MALCVQAALDVRCVRGQRVRQAGVPQLARPCQPVPGVCWPRDQSCVVCRVVCRVSCMHCAMCDAHATRHGDTPCKLSCVVACMCCCTCCVRAGPFCLTTLAAFLNKELLPLGRPQDLLVGWFCLLAAESFLSHLGWRLQRAQHVAHGRVAGGARGVRLLGARHGIGLHCFQGGRGRHEPQQCCLCHQTGLRQAAERSISRQLRRLLGPHQCSAIGLLPSPSLRLERLGA